MFFGLRPGFKQPEQAAARAFIGILDQWCQRPALMYERQQQSPLCTAARLLC